MPDPINADSALRTLIPGKYYFSFDNDTLRGVAWKCKRHGNRNPPVDDAEDEAFTFPDAEFNFTTISNFGQYKDDAGNEWAYLTLSTSNLNEYPQTGRFYCGYLGVAVFKKADKNWQLRYFNPNIDCMGQFYRAPTPRIVKLGANNFGFYLDNPTGSWMAPNFDTHLCAFVDDKWKTILSVENSQYDAGGRYDTTLFWRSTLNVPLINSDMTFNDVELTTIGTITSPKGLDTTDINFSNFPTSLVTTLLSSQSPSINFKFKTVYHFQNGKYDMVKQEVLEVK